MNMIRAALPVATVSILSLGLVKIGTSQEFDPLRGLNAGQVAALNAPFVGVTTDGRAIEGLYPLRSTGISTEATRAAAERFLAGLTADQRERALFPIDDPEWRMWINTPQPARQGVSFEEMSPGQRELAFGLIRASLSAAGAMQAENIMKLNGTLAELVGPERARVFGRWNYAITMMGTPSASEPWGWQLDGHHLIINYFVLGDQVVMTPSFFGSEPVRATDGEFAGTVVLQAEQDLGLALFTSLDPMQQAVATLRTDKSRADGIAGAYADNVVLDYAGIGVRDLNGAQVEQLLMLIAEYIGREPDGHAAIHLSQVRRHLDDTYFAWIGTDDPDGVFYYRIQSPVLLIEFDHQGAVIPGAPPGASRNHIHTVIRSPNGNDYGKDLLRQHYAQTAHGK
jgi:hypothetical protein